MEEYVGDVFRGVPQHRLKAFSFQRQTPLSREMIDRLNEHHGRSLRHLQCCEVDTHDQPEMSVPSNLHSLECRSIGLGGVVAHVIASNRQTLKSLSIGQDKQLLQRYRERRVGFLNLVQQPPSSFYSMLDLGGLPGLVSLSLSGLDLEPLVPQTHESALFLTRLNSITLESCLNVAPFFDIMSSTFSHIQSPASFSAAGHSPLISLKKLSFRHEFFTNQIRDSLIRFLTSFVGLNSLTLLVENTTFTTRPSVFLAPHGSTLETLVLESRIQPREHLQIDTSRPFGTSTMSTSTQQWLDIITDISNLCPRLIELGIAFPWSDTTVQQATAQLGQTLKSLQVLHVRNLPALQTTDAVLNDNEILNCATRFLRWLCPSSTALETLALGPTLYSTRWRLSTFPPSSRFANPRTMNQIHPIHSPQLHSCPVLATQPEAEMEQQREREQTQTKKDPNPICPPAYLRTHYFSVVGYSGAATVKLISEHDMQETRDSHQGLGGVFETVWLR